MVKIPTGEFWLYRGPLDDSDGKSRNTPISKRFVGAGIGATFKNGPMWN